MLVTIISNLGIISISVFIIDIVAIIFVIIDIIIIVGDLPRIVTTISTKLSAIGIIYVGIYVTIQHDLHILHV